MVDGGEGVLDRLHAEGKLEKILLGVVKGAPKGTDEGELERRASLAINDLIGHEVGVWWWGQFFANGGTISVEGDEVNVTWDEEEDEDV